MHFTRLIIMVTILFLLNGYPMIRAQTAESYAAADTFGIAELTAEETQFLKADFFPFGLAEKGRQSAPSWRGMPPGFLDLDFDGIRLNNPLWGYWDNQNIPIELVRSSTVQNDLLIQQLRPVPVREIPDPVTRIAYSQDFQFGLSYLDATHTQFYRPGSYFRLGGGNFVRDGSAGQYSRIQFVNYRVQFHHRFSDQWKADLWYWQIRHKFALAPFPVVTEDQRFHRIGQVMWLKVTYSPDSTRSLEIVPYGYKWGDRWQRDNFSIQRKTELYSTGIRAVYTKNISSGQYGLRGDAVRHKITSAFVFRKNEQWDGRIAAFMELANRIWKFRIDAGFWHTADIGSSPEIGVAFGWKGWRSAESVISVYQKAQSLPLAPRAWTGYSISPLDDPALPIRRGGSWKFRLPDLPGVQLTLEPYYNKFSEAWYYSLTDSAFVQQEFDNTGVLIKADLDLRLIKFYNDFSYNWEKSFIPETNYVLKIMLPITLLGGNLKLENYGIYHFIRKWYRLDYDPLVNQYIQSNQLTGPFHLLDVKILAHIKTATIFLVWDNLLSEDYALVDNYFELYRGFRFGIYWTLFN